MQRVHLADFLRLEAKLKLDFSDTRDLIIYRTDEGHIRSALTIHREDTKFILSLEYADWASPTREWKSDKLLLPDQIAQRVVESFKLMLEYHVLAPPAHQKDFDPGFGHNRWIFLRVGPKDMIAGFVPGYTMHSPRGERAAVFSLLLYQLERLCRDDAHERDTMLTEIDKMTGVFLIEEKKLRGR